MKKINLAIFFSNYKGYFLYNYLKNKKYISIKKIYLGKKHLNRKLLPLLKKTDHKIIDDINSISLVNEIKKLNVDIIIIAGLHYIFKNKLINSPNYCIINLHSGRVPNYRGGSPLNWQIINNEKNFYLSILKVDEGIDTGELLMEKKFILKKNYDINKLHQIANKHFPLMVEKVILGIFTGTQKYINQNSIKIKKKYFRQRKPEDGKIEWAKKNNLQVYNLIRATTTPYPGSFSYSKKKKIIFFSI